MKTIASVLGVVLLSVILERPASATQRWCGDTLQPCGPDPSMGWMLFVDANQGAPDFWWTEWVTVLEILRCPHGVQFLFLVQQRGQRHHAALVFPNPTRRMLAERLDLDPDGDKLESEYQHFKTRYEALTASLEKISGGTLIEGSRISFQDSAPSAPVIIPKHLLALYWRGEELKLRGYLDVYFAPAP